MTTYTVKGMASYLLADKPDVKLGFPDIEADSELDAAAAFQLYLGQDIRLYDIKVRDITNTPEAVKWADIRAELLRHISTQVTEKHYRRKPEELCKNMHPPTNEDRAERARGALTNYATACGAAVAVDDETCLADFMCDLMHMGIGTEALLDAIDTGQMHYEAEIAEESPSEEIPENTIQPL
jgi:hypothetical protein